MFDPAGAGGPGRGAVFDKEHEAGREPHAGVPSAVGTPRMVGELPEPLERTADQLINS
ncbi:hypothetical protein [Nonomuraea dietziae]|uniref:hypothetical protein n=1 Tax=Nonomuraea dietziae TaxID=65515 RepID=UPI0033CE8B6D